MARHRRAPAAIACNAGGGRWLDPRRQAGLGRAAQILLPGGGEGLVVSVLGQLRTADRADLAVIRNAGSACVGVLLDLDTWGVPQHPRSTRDGAHLNVDHVDAVRNMTG